MIETSQFSEFSFSEYDRRYQQLRLAMEQRGLDAILITNRTNHRYFSGFYAEVFALDHYYYFAILPRDKRSGAGLPLLPRQ